MRGRVSNYEASDRVVSFTVLSLPLPLAQTFSSYSYYYCRQDKMTSS